MEGLVVQIIAQAMIAAAKVCGPVLVVTLVVGLALSVVQSATQLQEATLTFLPKLVAAAAVLVLAGVWMLRVLESFTVQVFDHVPQLLGS